MSFQNYQSISKNLLNDNIIPSQSLFLNPTFDSYYKPFNNNNKLYIETPKKINMLSNNNGYNIENSFNKSISYKYISDSINREFKHSSNNFINLINTPQFEKICNKIFFPQNDPFHLSSTKKTPNKKDIKNNIQSSLLNENNDKENINNINNNYNQSTKRKLNLNYSSPKTKIKNSDFSTSVSKSYSNKRNISKNKKLKNNLTENKYLSENNVNTDKLLIKRNKNKKYINELRGLLKNEKKDIFEEISSGSSIKTKSNNKSENKIKNILKNKKISKKNNIKKYSKRAKKYNILSEEVKKKLLLDSKHMRTIEVARKYGISTRNINRWKKLGIKRKRGSGRKFKDPGLEKKILIWYNFQDKKKVTAKDFRKKALELSSDISFRASSGWLTSIKKKYHIIFKKN